MHIRHLKAFLFFLLIYMYGACLPAQANQHAESAPNTSLRVGIAGTEPFVFETEATGIAVDIWEKLARQQKWHYVYIPFENVDEALRVLKKDSLDIVVGPISITSKRLETMRFSQPFYNSSISILSRLDHLSFWGKIKPLFSFKLLGAVGIFLIILAIVGTLLWLAERNESPDQFPHGVLNGIGTGMWLAIVTMSTTGYGDKAPITLMGRIIAGSWMIISIIFATSMVAGIASTLTLSSIDSTTVTNVEQLAGKQTATISGSPSEKFLKNAKAKVLAVNTLDDAIEALENKHVEAVVYDRPQLLYFLKEHKKTNLYLSKAEYAKQGYGFAFPLNSTILSQVNRTLLQLAEDQEITETIHTYIEKDE